MPNKQTILRKTIKKKIRSYAPKGGIDQTALFFLNLCSIRHQNVEGHCERVALAAEAVAKKLGKDAKATFFAGIFHDVGKLTLPADLFSGREITDEEYVEIKTHARAAFLALQNQHMFVALCAGLHHAMYRNGYGLTIRDFPKEFSPATAKKILEISTIISICDFIDAYRYRKSGIRDGSDASTPDLKQMLYAKYPCDQLAINLALSQSF